MQSKGIVKKFTFSKEERDMMQNIQIGIINAQATNDGLQMYRKALLNSVYKRLGIDGEKKGFTKSITYNLSINEITYTQTPEKKDLLAKK